MSLPTGVDNKTLKKIEENTEEIRELMENYLSKSVELLDNNTDLLRKI